MNPIAEIHSAFSQMPLAAIHSWSTLSPERWEKTLQHNPLLWPCLCICFSFLYLQPSFNKTLENRISHAIKTMLLYLESTENEILRLQSGVFQPFCQDALGMLIALKIKYYGCRQLYFKWSHWRWRNCFNLVSCRAGIKISHSSLHITLSKIVFHRKCN